MPMRGPRGVEPTRILQRVGPSWDVGCATDRLDERPAAPLHQFTPSADAEANLVLPGGALALERCWGVRSLVERCLAFLVQHHPMLFWGWHGSQAAAEWLTLEFERRDYCTISAICRLNVELLAREYRRLWDIELLVNRLLGPLNQLWQAHRVENGIKRRHSATMIASQAACRLSTCGSTRIGCCGSTACAEHSSSRLRLVGQ